MPMPEEISYYPLAEAESELGLKPGDLLLLGAQGKLPIYVLADCWYAHVFAPQIEEVLEENDKGDLQVAGYEESEASLISPLNAPYLLNGPVRLTSESISRFKIQSPVAINSFMLPEPKEGEYPNGFGMEYRLVDYGPPSKPRNVQVDIGQLFILYENFKQLLEHALPKEEKPVSETERASLYKLILGMGMTRYEYDPKKAQNHAVTNIAKDLECLGLNLTDDTIRKWLKEAASVFPSSMLNKK